MPNGFSSFLKAVEEGQDEFVSITAMPANLATGPCFLALTRQGRVFYSPDGSHWHFRSDIKEQAKKSRTD